MLRIVTDAKNKIRITTKSNVYIRRRFSLKTIRSRQSSYKFEVLFSKPLHPKKLVQLGIFYWLDCLFFYQMFQPVRRTTFQSIDFKKNLKHDNSIITHSDNTPKSAVQRGSRRILGKKSK